MKKRYALLALLCLSCNASQQQVIQDVTIGVNAVVCLITTYETDISNNETDVQAILDAGTKCGVIPTVANQILAAHIAGKQKVK